MQTAARVRFVDHQLRDRKFGGGAVRGTSRRPTFRSGYAGLGI